jgi:hypothetical protein
MAAAAAGSAQIVYSDERLNTEWAKLTKELITPFILEFSKTNIAHAFGLGISQDSEDNYKRLVELNVNLHNTTRRNLETFYPALLASKEGDSTFTLSLSRHYPDSSPIALSTFLARFFLVLYDDSFHQMQSTGEWLTSSSIALQFPIPSLEEDAHKVYDGSVILDEKEDRSNLDIVKYFVYFKVVFLNVLLKFNENINDNENHITIKDSNINTALNLDKKTWRINQWRPRPQFGLDKRTTRRYMKHVIQASRMPTNNAGIFGKLPGAATPIGGAGAGAGAGASVAPSFSETEQHPLRGGARRRATRRSRRPRRRTQRR